MPTLKVVETLTFPLGDEASPNARPATTFELVYTDKHADDVSVGIVVDQSLMGSITNAKGAIVECTSGACTIKANAGTGLPLKAAQGGFRYFNPDGGLTTLTVSAAAAARIRVYLFT